MKRTPIAACHHILAALTLTALLAPPVAAQESSNELGRLFFTPERRQILDRQRQQNTQQEQDTSADPSLTINGIVTRSSGKRTAWINDRPLHENEIQSEVILVPNRKEPGRIIVQASESPAAKARVGETVNRNTGESSDLLEGGQIDIRPARRANPTPFR